jgi:hypothetical protein
VHSRELAVGGDDLDPCAGRAPWPCSGHVLGARDLRARQQADHLSKPVAPTDWGPSRFPMLTQIAAKVPGWLVQQGLWPLVEDLLASTSRIHMQIFLMGSALELMQ